MATHKTRKVKALSGETRPNPTVRECVMVLLRRHGMTTLFGNPGSTELPMLRDFPEDFRYVLGLQESVVVGMADGFAQACGSAAFVNLHSAAGVGHAMGAIFTAYKNRTPLVVTAGQQARSMLPLDPFLHSPQVTDLPKPFVKWACEPARAEDVPAAIERAWHIAMQEPRGPVFVSVPVDDWDRPCEPVPPRRVSQAQRPDPAMLAELGSLLDRSRSPVFVTGAAIDRGQAWQAVVELAERYQARVLAAPMAGRVGFPEDHVLFGGHLPPMRERIVEMLAGHDLVLAVGSPAFTYHVEGQGPFVPPGTQLAQIIEDPGIAAWTPQGLALVGNIRLAVEDLLARPVSGRRKRAKWRQARPRLPLPAPGEPMSAGFVFQALADLRRPEHVIVEEVPTGRGAMQAHLPHTAPASYQAMCSGGLGFGMAAAVGIALADPQRRVVAVIGDGSCMYTVQALWTAAREKLPISFVIMKNGRYAALQSLARVFGFRAGEAVVGTSLEELDFVGLARAQGCEADRVAEGKDLAAALERALESPRPFLLEVAIS